MELIEATIIAKGHQRWIEAVTKRYGAKLRLIHSKRSRRRDEALQVFEIIVDVGLKDRLVHYLKNDPDVSEVEITKSSHGRLLGMIRARGVIMRCVADSDCFLVYASSYSGDEIAWRVLGTDGSLRDLLSALKKRGIDFTVGDISEVRRKQTLTARQEWLLRTAYEEGYFDYPKRIRLGRLAQMLKVSPPTLYESLRKTQKKLYDEHFGNVEPKRFEMEQTWNAR
ncbi:MAG TPA: helix-turn-helix domain-containing protein [Nitrososphaerales archaeon]|nr:helix-turn-helix domain-containing protein [Nitrososphaerales archaeon]